MRICKKCIQPDTRPGIYFNEKGVCGACLYEEEKKTINWTKREQDLKDIAEWTKEKARENNGNYDCVIGVSGGKDSTFQALYARDRLGLRPLLVNSEPEGITEIGQKNIENLKNLGFDVVALRPNPKVMKKLMKKDFYEHLNPLKVTEFSLHSSVYIIADKFNISLVVQGENAGLTLGVSKTGLGTDGDALKINMCDTLSTGWERYMENGITEKDLFMFHYDPEALKKKGIRGIWLQYYIKEWSPNHNAEFSMAHGLTIKPKYTNPYDTGTYVLFNQLDSEVFPVQQLLKYIKFGFGQCMDHVCYDIREGRLTREEAIELVKKYDGRCGLHYIQKFCDYIDITVEEFWRVAESFRGSMWKKDKPIDWGI